jgi:CRISPR/Cas system-associated exonuclease Cas4 (RecB family)
MLWAKGWGMIDVGGGPGMPRPIPIKESRHHAVMGIVLAAAMEKLYNDELWRDPKNLSTNLLSFLDREWFRQLKNPRNYIDYNKARLTAAEMLEVAREGVLGYLQTMKAHSLLSLTYARSEVDLIGWVDKWNPVGGRVDLMFRRKDGVTIIDGKNSRRRETVDADQLRWYGLLYRLAYKEMPHRLGFVWFRYPYGADAYDDDGNRKYDDDGNPMIEQGVEWVPFTLEDFQGLAHRAVEAKKGMRKELFPANPVPSYCKYCVYESVCKERQAQKAANSEKRGKKKHLDEIEGGGGFSDFSL